MLKVARATVAVANVRRGSSFKQSSNLSEVLFLEHPFSATITLNRPKSLNAYNQEMVLAIDSHLKQWRSNNKIKFVVIEGAGGRSFCAGGDILNIYDIYHEYMQYAISRYPKPIIAFVDGLCLGGGMGIALNCSQRIVTDRSCFAVPETSIGYYPDGGTTFYLSRLPGALGMYFALTGTNISASDAHLLGICDCVIPHHAKEKVKSQLMNCSSAADLSHTLSILKDLYSTDTDTLSLNVEEINTLFNAKSIHDIFENLENSKSEFSRRTLSKLRKASSTALCVTFKLMTLAREMSLKEVIKLEYGIFFHVFESGELDEGVRALLVDKDYNPQWKTNRLADIEQTQIDKIFDVSQHKTLVL